MSWPIVSIGEITKVVTKGTTPKLFVNTGVNYIKAEALNGDTDLEPKGIYFIDEQVHESLQRSQLKDGDVLLTIAGAQIGKCGFVSESHLPANTNQAVGIMRLISHKAIPKFVYYFFKQNRTFKLIQGLNSQAAQPNINLAMLKQIKLPLPPLAVQQKVASFLSVYDDLIENNRRRIQLLEESARLLYKEWFVFLRFPGHEHTKIVDGIPDGWGKKPLKELCYQYKKTIKPSEVSPDTPYIGLGNIPRRSITLSDWETSEKVTSSKYIFKNGDILFGKIRPYFHKVGFALCNGITSSDSVVLRAQEEKYYCYLLAYVSSDNFVQLASKTCREGAKMPRADWKYLEKQAVLVPSKMLLMEFSEQQNDILKQLKTLALCNQKLAQARDLLLPRLMNGEIEV